MSIRKVKAGLVKTVTVDGFVGEVGNVFFDINDGSIRLSDGVTPGGAVIIGGTPESLKEFSALLDTPNSFFDAAEGYLKVNSEGTAIEFVQESTFSGTVNTITPTVSNGDLEYDASTGDLTFTPPDVDKQAKDAAVVYAVALGG